MLLIHARNVQRQKRCEPCAPSASNKTRVHTMLAKTNGVDFRKLLRDTLRGGFIETEHIPVPMGGPISPDDEHDALCEILSDEELVAYAQLVAEVRAEAIAAGEKRIACLQEFDKAIAECGGVSTTELWGATSDGARNSEFALEAAD
jgi:hypothetical protein